MMSVEQVHSLRQPLTARARVPRLGDFAVDVCASFEPEVFTALVR
jgi:hypothetical protein